MAALEEAFGGLSRSIRKIGDIRREAPVVQSALNNPDTMMGNLMANALYDPTEKNISAFNEYAKRYAQYMQMKNWHKKDADDAQAVGFEPTKTKLEDFSGDDVFAGVMSMEDWEGANKETPLERKGGFLGFGQSIDPEGDNVKKYIQYLGQEIEKNVSGLEVPPPRSSLQALKLKAMEFALENPGQVWYPPEKLEEEGYGKKAGARKYGKIQVGVPYGKWVGGKGRLSKGERPIPPQVELQRELSRQQAPAMKKKKKAPQKPKAPEPTKRLLQRIKTAWFANKEGRATEKQKKLLDVAKRHGHLDMAIKDTKKKKGFFGF